MLASTTKFGVEFSEPSLAAKRAREDSGMVPLIIPVSVPVRTADPAEAAQAGGADEDGRGPEHNPAEHKASVIVTRRRSTRVPGTDAPAQVGQTPPAETSGTRVLRGPGTLWGKDGVAEGAVPAACGDTISVFQSKLDRRAMGDSETVLCLKRG